MNTTLAPDRPHDDTDTDADTAEPTRRPRWMRWATWAVAGVVTAVALMYGAIFFYAKVLNDAPDALDEGDLTAALADDPATADETASAPNATDTAASPAATGFDGAWIATDGSEFGYRVDEVLSGVNVTAVGRSSEVDARLTVDGTSADVDVTVQVADIRSDDGRRDGQFRGRIMDAETFPTASFRTTEPIDLGALPELGEQITATVVGELTLRGETRPVTFDVTAQATQGAAGERIGVLGSIPVVFDDFGIPEPSIGTISVEDHGLVEFVLVFGRA